MMRLSEKVIDSHVHLGHWMSTDGTTFFEAIDNIQKETGLEKICIAALGDRPLGGSDINIMAALYKHYSPTTYAYGSLVYPQHPNSRDFPADMEPLTQYHELMAMGFDGIKILYEPDYPREVILPVNDPMYEHMFAQIEADGTPILWHVADPEQYWEGEKPYYNETYPTYREMFEQVFDVMKKHPKLRVTFAHFLFLERYPQWLEVVFDTYSNVNVDLAPGTLFEEFAKRPVDFRNFLEHYADRILFGSDALIPDNGHSIELIEEVYSWLVPTQYNNEVQKGLALSQDACDKILYRNFTDSHAKKPKPVCLSAVKAYAEKYAACALYPENIVQIESYLSCISK